MFEKKIFVFLLLIIAVLVLSGIVAMPKIKSKLGWKSAADAAASLPYQIGLTKAIVTPCVVLPPPHCSVGGPSPDPLAVAACSIKDVGQCTLYSYVSGMKAGGMGTGALFSNIAIAKAGLTPGGQLIAGGMSPVLMDNGVLVSAGGCFGCTAKAEGLFNKIADAADFIIAGFKNPGK